MYAKYALVLLIVALIGSALYLLPQSETSTNEPRQNLVRASSEELDYVDIARRVPTPGYKHYTNDAYQFSLFYPNTFLVSEHPEKNRAMTITFQDPSTLKGFQLFVLPYTESTISEERFTLDVPSGVRENVLKSYIDGIEAVSFESELQNFGETKELWFIHYGYLYELTAEKGNEELLEAVRQSWEFY